MIKKRRSQVTIFFIIAVLILIAGLIILNLRSSFLEQDYVAPELVFIEDYVGNCIEDVSNRAIMLLGITGGYTEIPKRINNDPRAYLNLGPGLNLPYWWHDGISTIPDEDFIKRELENYINTNLDICLDNFKAFEGQYKINELRILNTKITLTENNVIVDVDYPLEISYQLNKTKLKIQNFKKVIPIRVKKVFELARTIMDRENKEFFLEKKTVDLMAMNREIPTTDIEVSCNEKIWNLMDVKDKLKSLLSSNLPFIRIKNTDYNENAYVPTPDSKNTYKDSYYNYHYIWEVSTEIYQDIKTSFSYDKRWPFDIDARPRKGQLLKSNSMNGRDILSWFCLHIWHFTYDVIYPVKTTITDATTNTHKEFTLNFAFKVSVDHNQPNRNAFAHTILDATDRGTSEEYCNDLYNEIAVYTIANTTEPYDLNDVNLTLTCGAYTCPLGKSEYLSSGAASGIIKQMPYCVNAILKGKKQGFEEAKMFIQANAAQSYTLYLAPVKEFSNYKVVKHPLLDPASEENLKATEKVSISISAKDTSFETFGVYPTEENFPIKLPADKQHTYDVMIYLTDGDNLAGGYNAEWTVTPEELENSNQIVFHVLDQGFGSDEDKFLFFNQLKTYSNKIPKPEIK